MSQKTPAGLGPSGAEKRVGRGTDPHALYFADVSVRIRTAMRSDRNGSRNTSPPEALPQWPQSLSRSPRAQGPGTPPQLSPSGGVFLGRFPSQRNQLRPEKLSRRPSRLNREAYHATKAALAGLRSGSIRSAGYRNGYDCTARI